jgi:hypothetical protein
MSDAQNSSFLDDEMRNLKLNELSCTEASIEA